MIDRFQLIRLGLVVAVLLSAKAYSTELDVGFDSRYVSEGRNNLGQEGIAWLQLSHQVDTNVSILGLYGASAVYDELNIGLVYSQQVDSVAYYASVTHLAFFKDGQTDNELGVGAAYTHTDWLTLAVDVTYSVEAEGAFAELSALTSWPIHQQWSLNPYFKLGFDYGYASDIRRGFNHSAIGTEVQFAQSDKLALKLIIEHNQLSHSVQQQSSDQQSWAGLHLLYTF